MHHFKFTLFSQMQKALNQDDPPKLKRLLGKNARSLKKKPHLVFQ